jgi:hypothetical protein
VGSSTQLTDVWNQKLIQDIPSTMDGVLPFSISGSKETTRVDRPKFTFSAWYGLTRPPVDPPSPAWATLWAKTV